MRVGRRLAIDVGKVRIGVAASDFHAILASGVSTITRSDDISVTISEILRFIAEIDPIEIYVGYPVSLSGKGNSSSSDAISFAKEISSRLSVPIRLIDERMTTITASNALKLSGRDSKTGRKVIDQIAATVILEQAIETERLTGKVPGIPIEEIDE